MDEFIYSLLLTGEQGLSLFGTLRFRFAAPLAEAAQADQAVQAAKVADGGVPALLAEIAPLGTVTVVVLPVEGTISVPLLTGFSRVPIAGALLATAAGPVTTLFGSTDPARPLFLQFNQISGAQVVGGLQWRTGQTNRLVFSMLGTRLQLAF